MASGDPLMNGDISLGPGSATNHPCTLEETLQQMNILIQENRDLKEALQQTNLSMKERFEGLSTWREKQKEERDFLESRLEEARSRIEALTVHNQELRRMLEELEESGGLERRGQTRSANRTAELEALRSQVARLQAEKNDLVAMNSELQLKMGHGSPDSSFIEIIRIADGGVEDLKDGVGGERNARLDASMSASRQESEEVTVSHLLQSLRNETQKVERLQTELQSSHSRIIELEVQKSCSDEFSQTSFQPETTRTEIMPQEDSRKDETASEVENMKSEMMTLLKELQQAQSKLYKAENMKKNIQDRYRDLEHDVATLHTQLLEKQGENDKLNLQLDSIHTQSLLEQRRTEEERNNLTKLKDAYTKLFEDYNDLKEKKRRESQIVAKEVVDNLEAQLAAAERALATKQEHIDAMKQEIYQKEKALETISVFQAQAEVYSSDFYAERAAREKIHEEKECLAAQLELVKKHNIQLQEDMESLGRQSLNEMQKRHMPHGGNPHGGAGAQGGTGGEARDWQQQVNIPEHACPKCNEILPDLDSLHIHIMDCII